jgi:hypothetical protein
MRCLSCSVILTDEEASLKYENSETVINPEDRYIGLCKRCLRETDLAYYVADVGDYDVVEIEEE